LGFGDERPVTLTPLVMSPEPAAAPPTAATKPRQPGGRIEIALSNGRRLIVGAGVDSAAVARLTTANGRF
jgi:hypothetical protein